MNAEQEFNNMRLDIIKERFKYESKISELVKESQKPTYERNISLIEINLLITECRNRLVNIEEMIFMTDQAVKVYNKHYRSAPKQLTN